MAVVGAPSYFAQYCLAIVAAMEGHGLALVMEDNVARAISEGHWCACCMIGAHLFLGTIFTTPIDAILLWYSLVLLDELQRQAEFQKDR
jgi:hypothetical protein